MDSLLVKKLFQRLFSHQICSRLRTQSSLPFRDVSNQAQKCQLHGLWRGSDRHDGEIHWQPKTDLYPDDRSRDFQRFPMVTADALQDRRHRPKKVKMLARDFIEDSLYNPNYGYFSKQAIIFTAGESFDFNAMAGDHEFQSRLGRRYTDFENELDAQDPDDTRQLWHTPTELFRPYYGEAIARYLVTNYKSCCSPYHDLIIYEMGAGNGTLMLNILDYIREFHPDIYNRTKYKVIEISSSMASIQSSQLTQSSSSHGHASHVEIINRSIFAWDNYVAAPCYFLALEVIDNFAHDAIRYDPFTEEPLQANVLVDNYGEFYEFYTKEVDPVAARFLRIRDAACSRPFEHPLKYPRFIRNFKSRLPFAGNLTVPEYIPTRLMEFFDILRNFFPLHRLLTSDFHYLPDTIKGINAPVVQTRYQRQVVPVKTLFVKQGYFDILFPTDFSVMEDMYRAITGNVSRVLSHEDFLQHWACVEDTQTRNGENPLLSWYANASVMMTA